MPPKKPTKKGGAEVSVSSIDDGKKQLDMHMTELSAELAKLMGGNKTAGKRARAHLGIIGKLAKPMRALVQEKVSKM